MYDRATVVLVAVAAALTACRSTQSVAGAKPPETARTSTRAGDGKAEERPGKEEPAITATQADADALCQEILLDHEEQATVRGCRFVDGKAVGVGRIDVLEVELDTLDDLREAYVVLRVDELPELELIAQARMVPGYEEDYRLGKLRVKGDEATLKVTFITRTIPNTGAPEQPSGETVEKETAMVTCYLDPEEAGCESRDEH